MDLFTVTIGVSILIYIVIGSYAGRNVKKLDDYFVAGRRARLKEKTKKRSEAVSPEIEGYEST